MSYVLNATDTSISPSYSLQKTCSLDIDGIKNSFPINTRINGDLAFPSYGIETNFVAKYKTDDSPRIQLLLFNFFQTFLGQKYGYRPFPPKIEARLFETILAATEATDDKNLLNFWFAKDENSMAQYYLLHPISSKLPAYVDEGNAAKKKQV